MARAAGSLRAPRFHHLVIVSSRLPSTPSLNGGSARLRLIRDTLVEGLSCVHRSSAGEWIGCPVGEGPLPEPGLCSVPLDKDELAGFSGHASRHVLWPVLHGLEPDGAGAPDDWASYLAANQRFAELILDRLRPGDRVWVHDYQLMFLPRLLRCRKPDARVAFFLHTPFPLLDHLDELPQAAALMDGVLGADVVGFNTREHLERFAAAASSLLARRVDLVSGTGIVHDLGRQVGLHASPMSVDLAALATRATGHAVTQRAADLRAGGRPVFLGVDRIDLTAGLPQRLEAFGRMLEMRPDLRGRARLVQVALPPGDAPQSEELRCLVENTVSDLNARFSTDSWKPVEYICGDLDELELSALYRAADVMLVTPVVDGTSLVAKEFIASRTDGDGVLVLGEQAGAAGELATALRVDPRDIGGLVRTYLRAAEMPGPERRVRMRRLRDRLRAHDIHRWAHECLHELDSAVRINRPRLL